MEKRFYIFTPGKTKLIMDIQLEKSNIIKRLKKINDESLLQAVKSLLDYSQKNVDKQLDASIARGLKESKYGKGRAHKEVMADLREKYKE